MIRPLPDEIDRAQRRQSWQQIAPIVSQPHRHLWSDPELPAANVACWMALVVAIGYFALRIAAGALGFHAQ